MKAIGLKLALIFLRILVLLLPSRWLLALGRGLGRLTLLLTKRRKLIAQKNIELCFPNYSKHQQQQLLQQTFAMTGMALFETMLCWWLPEWRFQKIKFKVVGLEHYQNAYAKGHGVLLLSGHFTSLEISGRELAKIVNDCAAVYQAHKEPWLDQVILKNRLGHLSVAIKRQDLRGMIRYLRSGGSLWYAPDQDFGPKPSVFVPFFGVQTATLTATARLAKSSGATVVPTFFSRLPGYSGYEINFLPAFDNFPSMDNHADARRYNEVLEQYVLRHPSEYLWMHRRFKTRPEGEEKIY